MAAAIGSEHRWYHTLELPDGTTTAGYVDTRAARPYVQWPQALGGGRCLDVGTFDGFWAFEMERLGASEVVAVDLGDPESFDWPYDRRVEGPEMLRRDGALTGDGFRHAAAALGSRTRRECLSVYDLDPAVHGRSDVVVCGALLIHLRDPIRALEAIRTVCDGEFVLIESIDPVLELAARRIPCARFAPDPDKWWRLNSAGMRRALHRAGFEVTWVSPRFLVPHGTGFAGKAPLIDSIAAGTLRRRGGLHRVFRARARIADDSRLQAASSELPLFRAGTLR